MEEARQYIAQARKQNIPDEDIIMELTTTGWSIQDIHKLLFKPATNTAAPMFAKNPLVMQRQADQRARVEQARAEQAQQAQQSMPAQTQVPPQHNSEPVPQLSAKPKPKLKKVLLIIAGVLLVFSLGAGAGVGVSYLYVKAQLQQYSQFLSGPSETTDATGFELGGFDPQPGSTDAGVSSSDEAQGSAEEQPGSSNSGQSNSSSSGSSSSNNESKPNCSSTTSDIPDGVCQAVASIKQDTSSSNSHFSHFQGEIPSGVKVQTVDEDSWVATGNDQGQVSGTASIPIFGLVQIQAEFKLIDGQWKVIDLVTG